MRRAVAGAFVVNRVSGGGEGKASQLLFQGLYYCNIILSSTSPATAVEAASISASPNSPLDAGIRVIDPVGSLLTSHQFGRARKLAPNPTTTTGVHIGNAQNPNLDGSVQSAKRQEMHCTI